MDFLIEKLPLDQVSQFHQVFAQVMREGFEYREKIKEYFINKAYSASNFDYWLKYGYKGVLVAFLKRDGPYQGSVPNQIIGFLVYDTPYGGVLFARWMGVLKKWRGKRVGRSLMDEFVKLAKTLGCHKIEVAAQPKAREFYQKYGLLEEGYRRLTYFGIDQYLFGKVIGGVNEDSIIRS